ncbi:MULTISPECIES: 2-isopropylmalate synthase [unclassified Rubrivivax]|uniref:2-isopropylmalate synthase n=1 Tax=unclassified Rubrivivax TaxID=2649762 RepID=UPI001E4CB3A2|nr:MULTISPECIES: 2-isopropylmalate synthase [unclassified Rubrivivax]MCC9598736.1 2-isopropylmalate synthase [Rubrivivax sp. JA1055]MCC9648436.1 2-isopropylmalate synthase [Rubrivivax sp. JA1029]
MLQAPETKYRPYPAPVMDSRRWPSQTLVQAPVWLSTDLRDGNQALFEPMNAERKLRLFELLVGVGFKEIEVGFPAASATDHAFVRRLIDEQRLPADVTPMVMTQAREDLLVRTVESLRGARRAIVHLYNATAPLWRRVVFGMGVDEVLAFVDRHVRLLRTLTDAAPETEWVLQYSPETFCMTEPEVSLAACTAALEAWDAGPGRPVILNLPTTVEVATPNVFADQIEWMHRRLPRRQHVVLSIHPHNDRGTGVACAELALLAGAQRVEGTLFGNGERSGNVDLVTLALNLYALGVAPGLDFSDIGHVAREVEACTGLPLHPRHPYAGDLVFTAFSGSHQDAIRKGMAAQEPGGLWQVPYLPVDPQDLGRTYDGLIRVNSQSGKGGIAWLMERHHGLAMPRRMQVEFSSVVQAHADAAEAEVDADTLWQLFDAAYLAPTAAGGALAWHGHTLVAVPGGVEITLDVTGADGTARRLVGRGAGPVDAAAQALRSAFGIALEIVHFEERSIGGGSDAPAWALVEAAAPGVAGTRFGAGRHADIATAGVLAVLSAAARLGAAG